MRQYISIFFAALLISGLPACIFSDSEVYYVEPVPGDPPLISISTNLDTLYIPQVIDSLEVIYQVEISGGELYYVYAEIASSLVYESDSTHGSFWINPGMAAYLGIDTLSIEFYYSTNSNSFADKMGYEAQVNTLKYAINFDPRTAL